LSLDTSGKVGKSKNRRRAAEQFKNFPQLLRLIINGNKNAALQRKMMEICHVFANSRWAILSPVLLADSGVFGHFSAAFQYPLRIAQRLSNSLEEYFLASGYRLKRGNFYLFL
jgi:hypothetical protein